MLKQKKVLFLITKSNWGGAQRYVHDLATALPKDLFEAVVAAGGDGVLIAKLREASVRTIAIPSLQRDLSLGKELSSFRDIWRIVGQERPNILHVNSSKAGGIGALVGRLRGVPLVVYTAHGWAFNEERGLLSKIFVGFFHWLTIMLAHKTIAVSQVTKHQMRWPLAKRKMIVIHNGRQQPPFLDRIEARSSCTRTLPSLAPYAADFWTGTIAELHPVKCHDVVIDAIAELVTNGRKVRHLIIGAGESEESLRAQITAKGLERHVFLLDHIDEAARLLKAFDVFVLASRSEALAYVVIEAAQAALPIVATRVGGIPEIIEDTKSCILIPPHDPVSLAAALERLIADEALRVRLAQQAKERGAYFSLTRMVDETIALYDTTLSLHS